GLKREINRRLDVIDKIRKQFEPRLLNISGNLVYPKVSQSTVFRMKAVDELKNLENELEQIGIIQRRDPGKCVRAFLINLFNTTLWGPPQRLVHEFCDLYERARYSSDEFSEEHLVRYRSLMMKILEICSSCHGRAISWVCKPPYKNYAKGLEFLESKHPDVKENLTNLKADTVHLTDLIKTLMTLTCNDKED
ncbi:hypothetical protein QYM36_017525, partial [Artemia franciscana]